VFLLAEEGQAVEARNVPDLPLRVERDAVFPGIRVVGFIREPDREFREKWLACGSQKYVKCWETIEWLHNWWPLE
jgi:hypothetical protein